MISVNAYSHKGLNAFWYLEIINQNTLYPYSIKGLIDFLTLVTLKYKPFIYKFSIFLFFFSVFFKGKKKEIKE